MIFLNNKFIFLIYFLLVFNLLTYRITPSARHPFTPTPRPPPLLPPLVRFPELAVFTFCLPFWYFPHISSPFPYIPFHYYLYSPNEWEHTLFVLLRLTHFTQRNTLHFHPRGSKCWVSVVSNAWVIFHCVREPHLSSLAIHLSMETEAPSTVWLLWTLLLWTSGAGVLAFHCICIFGVNPQQCNCWVVGKIYF